MPSKTHVTLHITNEFILLNNHLSFSTVQQSLAGQNHLITEGSRPHSDTLHSVGLVWTSNWPTQRPLHDNTQHSQERNIHFLRGIQTHNPSNQMAADPRLRPCSHWEWLINHCTYPNKTRTNFTSPNFLENIKSLISQVFMSVGTSCLIFWN